MSTTESQPSTNNGPNTAPLPHKTKRFQAVLGDDTWRKIRVAYETEEGKPSAPTLAKRFNCSRSVIEKRVVKEKWNRFDSIASLAIRRVQQQSEQIAEQVASNVSLNLASQMEKSLAPWLEREKTRHLKNQILRMKKSFRRIDNFTAQNPDLTPKDESFIAKSIETYDTVARRNLGLTDGSVPQSTLSLNILTNHSSVSLAPVPIRGSRSS